MLSERSKSFTESSPSKPLTAGVAERKGGNFVANFCQTMLNGANSAAVLRRDGQTSGVREEEEGETAKDSPGVREEEGETAKDSPGSVVNGYDGYVNVLWYSASSLKE